MIYLRMLATDLTAIENALARFIARRDRSQLASTVGVFSKRRALPRKSAISPGCAYEPVPMRDPETTRKPVQSTASAYQGASAHQADLNQKDEMKNSRKSAPPPPQLLRSDKTANRSEIRASHAERRGGDPPPPPPIKQA